VNVVCPENDTVGPLPQLIMPVPSTVIVTVDAVVVIVKLLLPLPPPQSHAGKITWFPVYTFLGPSLSCKTTSNLVGVVLFVGFV
jgi:hypothetical protein